MKKKSQRILALSLTFVICLFAMNPVIKPANHSRDTLFTLFGISPCSDHERE